MLPSFIDALKIVLDWLKSTDAPERRKRRLCRRLERLHALLKTVLRDGRYLLAVFTRFAKRASPPSRSEMIPVRRVIFRQINNLHKSISAVESIASAMQIKLPHITRDMLWLLRSKMEFFDNIGLSLDLIYGIRDFSTPIATCISSATSNLEGLARCTETLRKAINKICNLEDLI